MEKEITQLKAQVAELLEWKARKESQQLNTPLDIASRNVIGAPVREGAGSSSLSKTINLASTPASFSVPELFTRSVIVKIENDRYEFPSYL